jgi:riboflavin synthase
MFSGIIEELGEVKKISLRANIVLLEIKAGVILEDTRIGDSIAVNGVCLTVIKKEISALSFELMPQTLRSTNLGRLRLSEKVNLERALKIGDRLNGHFVTGHIDTLGIIRKTKTIGANLCFEISVPAEFMCYVTSKGSIALDGISLTVLEKRGNLIKLGIIPHTFKNTTLGFKGPCDIVNVEFDILAKYLRENLAKLH